jgi:hypothetical protein
MYDRVYTAVSYVKPNIAQPRIIPRPWTDWSITKRTQANDEMAMKKFQERPIEAYLQPIPKRSLDFSVRWSALLHNMANMLPLVASFYQAPAFDALDDLDRRRDILFRRLLHGEPPAPREQLELVRPDAFSNLETVEERYRRFGQARFRAELECKRAKRK